MTDKITQFQGEYRWLSNFADCEVFLEGVLYPSVENAYQAAKTLDKEERKPFEHYSAGQAKRASRNITMRKDWPKVKESIMFNLLTQKYNKEPYITFLLDTKLVDIEEGNTWGDTYWGIDLRSGRGQNKLGKMIMNIRLDLLFWKYI